MNAQMKNKAEGQNRSNGLRILLLTQKMDSEDDVLGFMHGWAERLANRSKHLDIVALSVGRHKLPKNTEVFSLGKERGTNKIQRMARLYSFVLKRLFAKELDAVFIHMNQIYVFLLYPLLRAFSVPIVFWKAHGNLGADVRFAIPFVDRIVTSSESGFGFPTKKRKIICQGIDTDLFCPRQNHPPNTILSIGRISPIKGYDTLIDAADIIVNKKNKKDARFLIIGAPLSDSDKKYLEKLKEDVAARGLSNNFSFLGKVEHSSINKYYQDCEIFINTSKTGSLDKTVLEAMASATLVLNSNPAYSEMLDGEADLLMFEQDNAEELAEKMGVLLSLPKKRRASIGNWLRSIVVKEHNIDRLIDGIYAVLEEEANKRS